MFGTTNQYGKFNQENDAFLTTGFRDIRFFGWETLQFLNGEPMIKQDMFTVPNFEKHIFFISICFTIYL